MLLISALYGAGKIALLAAPLIAALSALYRKYAAEGEIQAD